MLLFSMPPACRTEIRSPARSLIHNPPSAMAVNFGRPVKISASTNSYLSLNTAVIGLNKVGRKIPTIKAKANAGSRNCQTETPAALATTNSPVRVNFVKASILPIKNANGSMVSIIAGNFNSASSRTRPSVALSLFALRRSNSTKSNVKTTPTKAAIVPAVVKAKIRPK